MLTWKAEVTKYIISTAEYEDETFLIQASSLPQALNILMLHFNALASVVVLTKVDILQFGYTGLA